LRRESFTLSNFCDFRELKFVRIDRLVRRKKTFANNICHNQNGVTSASSREILTLLGGATGWPLAARAQQSTMPIIGYLGARAPDDTTHLVEAFRRGLKETGFIDRQNVTVEYRWALGQYGRLPAIAAEFAHRPVAVIVATGAEPAALAAKTATSTVPIVFSIGGDPTKQGLAASFNRPGGNSTGITPLTNQLEPKRLGLLRQLVPQATTIGFLLNPSYGPSEGQLKDAEEAARAIRQQIYILRADTDDEIDAAFETVTRRSIPAAPFSDTRRAKLVALAVRHAVPTMYHFREFAEAGGLVSYGIDPADVYRQVGVYTGRVLKGDKPAELPVMQATKLEFVINLKTARMLGLDVPLGLSAGADADEVIE
jgi:putative ABC transport system substrate-binding protein